MNGISEMPILPDGHSEQITAIGKIATPIQMKLFRFLFPSLYEYLFYVISRRAEAEQLYMGAERSIAKSSPVLLPNLSDETLHNRFAFWCKRFISDNPSSKKGG